MERFEKPKHCCLLCKTTIIQSMGLGKEDGEEKLLGHQEGLLEGLDVSVCFIQTLEAAGL